MLRAVLPHPLLALTLVVVWTLLFNSFTPGTIVTGIIVAISVTKFTSVYWPSDTRVRNPREIIAYMAVFLWDIVLSNIQVARLVLFRSGDRLKSRFVTVPLDVTSPEAIVALAATITLTPGTLSVDVAADNRSIIVHCLDVDDPDALVAGIKERYELRLKRILT
ncbi:MAG: cation:proton antiporter [Alphaproteobacteria bacterium BRH_c36]|nr:MAG: cation:proton antiporter [Alphaproteobacteria bacterium BRH_c36]KUO67134.1 MAG: cation:proton antiporter [Alphaproteobacteria bacterium BRH_c36]